MSGTGEADLLAIALPRPAAAAAINDAWRAQRAVCVLDADAPPAARATAIAALAPTHLLDSTGERPLPDVGPGSGVDHDIAAVVATSGTSATPKAAELTWAGLEASAAAVSEALDVDPARDRWLITIPLSSVGGLAIVARALTTGTPYDALDRFDLEAVATAPRDHGATLVSLVATQLLRLLDAGAPMHQYRSVLLGGGPVPPRLRERARDAGVTVHATYGMTETWGGCVHDGHPLTGVDVRLAPDTAEIEIAGDCVMRRYRNDPAASAAARTPDAWYRTGDVGAWRGEGTLAVIDRINDLIITGGVNVSPTAVEAVLGTHPDILDVAVIGRPDAEWGERVVAWVVPRDPATPPTLDALRALGREQLRAAEVPRELQLVDAIPRTPSGKVLRRDLRASLDSSLDS